MEKVELVSLEPELVEATARLLNSQWPRSLEARKHSIEDSCNELPCSLLLVTKGNRNVIGHVRVMGVADRVGGAIVESLVVSPDWRRRGLGRRLMEAAEDHVRRLGYDCMHLSTHDQHSFYRGLGYTPSVPVAPVKKCTIQFVDTQEELAEDCHQNEQISTSETALNDLPIAPPPSAPPPPPPPLLPTSTARESDNNAIKWYKKIL